MRRLAVALVLCAASALAMPAQVRVPPAASESSAERATQSIDAGPIVVIDTDKGVIEFETYPDDAPKSVAHVLDLVSKGFYDGQRFHRVEPGFLVQFGDPKSRSTELESEWGRAPGDGSGVPVGVAEFSKRRTHVAGAVGLAHAGDPTRADSQIYITLVPLPQLDGRFVVFGQVLSGGDTLDRLSPGDFVRRVTVR